MDAQRPPNADLLRTLTARHPESAVVMVTGRGVADAVAAVMLAPPPGDAATPMHPRVHDALGVIAERFRDPAAVPAPSRDRSASPRNTSAV